jgi:hypothetical protein
MGSFKGDKSPMKWSQYICIWLDKWTHYRSPAEIERKYASYFSQIQSIEVLWLHRRLGSRKWLVSWLPTLIQQSITKKIGGRVIVARNT